MKSFITLLVLLAPLGAPAHAYIVGDNNIERLHSIDTKSELYQKSKSTGRLQLPGALGIRDYCTIFLISPNEAMTTAACLRNKDPSRHTAYFEYYDRGSKFDAPVAVKKFKVIDTEKDLVVIELEGKPGLKYGFYTFAKTHPANNEALLLFQHPALKEKSVVRTDCTILRDDEVNFVHTCDTENYAAGSPIFNSKFEVVGIHQGSFSNMEETYNYGRFFE